MNVAVWENVKLPDGQDRRSPAWSRIPPTWSSIPNWWRSACSRFAAAVGRENVIAGTDCGFGGRTHPQIAWAKLRSLVDGAALASRALA